eukprot:3782668-Prymnesium_polylepis.1
MAATLALSSRICFLVNVCARERAVSAGGARRAPVCVASGVLFGSSHTRWSMTGVRAARLSPMLPHALGRCASQSSARRSG